MKDDNNKIKLPPATYRKILFEITMIVLSSMIVFISLFDLAFGLSEGIMTNIRRLDLIVITIFALDLIVNFILAKEKILYIRKSIITILCVVPFSSFFRLAAMFRLNRVFLLLRHTRPSNIGPLAKLWVFFMKPGVIRVSKFFNLARSYFTKTNTKE